MDKNEPNPTSPEYLLTQLRLATDADEIAYVNALTQIAIVAQLRAIASELEQIGVTMAGDKPEYWIER